MWLVCVNPIGAMGVVWCIATVVCLSSGSCGTARSGVFVMILCCWLLGGIHSQGFAVEGTWSQIRLEIFCAVADNWGEAV